MTLNMLLNKHDTSNYMYRSQIERILKELSFTYDYNPNPQGDFIFISEHLIAVAEVKDTLLNMTYLPRIPTAEMRRITYQYYDFISLVDMKNTLKQDIEGIILDVKKEKAI